MPKAFEVSVIDDEVVRGVDDVEVTISGDSKSIRYELSGDCIWNANGTLTDGKIPASKIDAHASDEDENCDVTVVLTRTAEGNLDPNFGKGGQIVAIQERTFTFFSLARTTPPVGTPDAGESSSDATNSSDTSSVGSAPDAGDDSGDAGVSSDDGGISSGSTDAADASADAASTDATATGSDATSGGDSTSVAPISSDVADAGDAG
jgi:hypothetical protein